MRVLTTFVFCTVMVQAQWVNYRVKGVPRTADGKPNLTAPAPRVNGKPDLSGIWITLPAKYGESEGVIPGIGILGVPGDDPAGISKYFFNVLADYKEDEMMTAAAREAPRVTTPPSACMPPSPPMTEVLIVPRRWIQTPALIVSIYEGLIPRQIHMDGRPLPVDPQPSVAGYSVGKWDGDTLVVETIGITDATPLDGMGHPRTSATRLMERVRRRDFGHMDIEMTIHEPKYYTKPIVYRYTATLMPDDDLIEAVCVENEKDAPHMRPPGPPPAPPK